MGGTTVNVVIYLTATFAAGTRFRSTVTAAIPAPRMSFLRVMRAGNMSWIFVNEESR